MTSRHTTATSSRQSGTAGPENDLETAPCSCEWLEYAVSWVLVQFHALFSAIGFSTDSGVAWAGAIVGLVIVIRIA